MARVHSRSMGRRLVGGVSAVFVMVLAGVIAGSQPAQQTDDYGYDPKYLNDQQREGRDTWYFWTGGGEKFWVEMARVTDGNVNLLNYLDSRRHGRRFREPARLAFPLFVKSATEDASLGISQASLVEDVRGLRERVQFIHEQVESDALAEEYVDGREIYVGVLGNARLMALPPWEMDFGTLSRAETRIATRKVKWDRKYQTRHGIRTGKAQDLGGEELLLLSRLSKRIYRALYMTGFARMDFRLCSDGRLFLIEANCNPNLSKGEDFADSAKAAGIGYTALVDRIVQLGLASMPEWRQYAPRAGTVRQNVRSTPIT